MTGGEPARSAASPAAPGEALTKSGPYGPWGFKQASSDAALTFCNVATDLSRSKIPTEAVKRAVTAATANVGRNGAAVRRCSYYKPMKCKRKIQAGN